MAASVVDSVTTRPGNAGLRPGRPGLVLRSDALRRSASFDLKARSTRIPAPPTPWMELGCGENASPVTEVDAAVVEVVLLTAAVDFFLPPPDEHPASKSVEASTSADATKTSTNRLITESLSREWRRVAHPYLRATCKPCGGR